jgi:hypothetical protein
MPVDTRADLRLQEFLQQKYFSPRTMAMVHCAKAQV